MAQAGLSFISYKKEQGLFTMDKKILLIDGHSILSRAFYGIPTLTAGNGLHTNAVYGFINIMLKAMEDEACTHICVAFDLSRGDLWRTELYPEYKGQRKPMPEELLEQVPVIQRLLSAMDIPIVTLKGYEADDILGTLSRRFSKLGYGVTILSGDRDLLQLCTEEVKVSIPKTSKGRTEVFNYYPQDVEREYGVTPLQFIDMKALMGDTSDNIPGVPGIGEKTAASIIKTYKSIENAYAHVDEITPNRARQNLSEHYDMAELSKKLAAIVTDCPIELKEENAELGDIYTEEALSILRELEFKSLIAKFSERMSAPSKEESFIDGFKATSDKYLAKIVFEDAKLERSIGFYAGRNGERAYVGLALSKDRLYSFYSDEGEDSLSSDELLSLLSGLLGFLIAEGRKVYTLSLKDELKLLPDIGRNPFIYDISIGAYLLDPLKESYDYDDIARDHIGAFAESRSELLPKTSFSEALSSGDEEKRSKALRLPVYGAAAAFLASKTVLSRLKETEMLKLYEDIELPLIYSLNDMEAAGIRADRTELSDYAELLKSQTDAIEKEIYELSGEEFNINSPSQLAHILFEKLGLKGGKRTKTGYSTAADVLNKLAPDYPIVMKVLRYRTLMKLYSTYAAGLPEYIAEDGRIHGHFNQTVTATGRISSTEPNLQNIPVRTEEGKELRKVFVPAEGFTFVDADYSQVELRILTALSGDEKLIEAYKHAEDIHKLTASQVFHVPLSEVTAEMRRNAKAVNFGIVYGISAFGLGEGLSISRKEAQAYIDSYFETYPKVKEYLDKSVAFAKEHGYARTYFGRRRPIPELKSSNFMQRSFGERAAMNSPIQGTAADVMKIAMNSVNMRLSGLDKSGKQRGRAFKSRIVLQVHDELLIETALDELEEVKTLVKECMEGAIKLSVPLSCDINVGDSWYDCH